jgi:hypothetical protein
MYEGSTHNLMYVLVRQQQYLERSIVRSVCEQVVRVLHACVAFIVSYPSVVR